MSDLVGNPDDRFSQNEAHLEMPSTDTDRMTKSAEPNQTALSTLLELSVLKLTVHYSIKQGSLEHDFGYSKVRGRTC